MTNRTPVPEVTSDWLEAEADKVTPREFIWTLSRLAVAHKLRIGHLIGRLWEGVELDAHQHAIIESVLGGYFGRFSEVAIKGCTAAGKGTAVAIAANIWFELDPQARVIVTSVRHDHAVDVMFAEIVKWRKRMKFPTSGETLRESIRVDETKYMICVNPASPEAFSGHHGPATLFIYDESSRIREEFWSLGQTQARMRVAISNPRTLSGWFRRLFPANDPDRNQSVKLPGDQRRRLITVSGYDCLNVKQGEALIPGQITAERLAGIMAHPNPQWGRVFGEGCFPEEDVESQLILPSWLERHEAAWNDEVPVEAFGLDVADSDTGDETVLAAGSFYGVAGLTARKKSGAMETVGWVINVAKKQYGVDLKHGGTPICVDADGLGGPMANRLEELGCWVIYHRGGASANDARSYANYRTESYALLSIRLDPGGPYPNKPFALPYDPRLAEELAAQERTYESDAFRFRLMPKDRPPGGKATGSKGEADSLDTIKKKIGRSPDRADAVAYLYRAVLAAIDETADEYVPDDAFLAAAPDEAGISAEERSRAKQGEGDGEGLDPWIEGILDAHEQLERERDDLLGDW